MKLLGRDVLVTLPTSLEVSDVMLVLETLTPLDLSLGKTCVSWRRDG